jgi:hypothetical protein
MDEIPRKFSAKKAIWGRARGISRGIFVICKLAAGAYEMLFALVTLPH